MKIILLILGVVLASLLLSSVNVAAPGGVSTARGKLVHMVSFKFKENASEKDLRKVEEAFDALPAKISQIASYEWGTNISPEKLNKGFTHGFLLTFHSAKDRDEYLVHKDHKEFGQLIGPYIADVFVIDFWTDKNAARSATAK